MGENGKRGGHSQNWTEKPQPEPSTLIFPFYKLCFSTRQHHRYFDVLWQLSLATKSAAHAMYKSFTCIIAHGFRVPNNTNLRVCAPSLCAPQTPSCSVFVAPKPATKIDEQKRRLSDACMSAVPAEYAGPNSGSDDHPYKYDLHQFLTVAEQGALTASHTLRLSRKSLFSDSFFLGEKKLYLYSFISPRKTPPGTNTLQTSYASQRAQVSNFLVVFLVSTFTFIESSLAVFNENR